MKAALIEFIQELFGNALRTSYTLFKIILPVSIITRLLQEWGLIEQIGIFLAPVMKVVGLPGEMSLVWAASMITNIYGGMIVFASLAPELELTVAQVSVLGAMILVAHSLPVELMIAKKAGARLPVILAIRVLGALLLGWLLKQVYDLTGTLGQASQSMWVPPVVNPGWAAWALAELRNLLLIFLIILALLAMMALLKRLGIINLLVRLMGPILKLLGISHEAAPLTIIGMTMGISYGGGLIINEARAGTVAKKDLFTSITLMSLCHSLFEDTMLMVLIGGHLSALLWGRLLFALLVTLLLVKLINRLPNKLQDRYLFSTIGQ
ncbi:MAG: nucleoside recognition domain-containing protein [Dethiobacteria bacterium]|nr:nucleoside recognition domain-containing protein [Dethiobacteria bacterium]